MKYSKPDGMGMWRWKGWNGNGEGLIILLKGWTAGGLGFTARCYASAVLAMGLCLSVTSRSSTKTATIRYEMLF